MATPDTNPSQTPSISSPQTNPLPFYDSNFTTSNTNNTTSNNKNNNESSISSIRQTLKTLLSHLPPALTTALTNLLTLSTQHPHLSTFILSQTLCAAIPLLLFFFGVIITALVAVVIAVVIFVDASQLVLIPVLMMSSVFATVIWGWSWAVYLGGSWVLRVCSGSGQRGREGEGEREVEGRMDWLDEGGTGGGAGETGQKYDRGKDGATTNIKLETADIATELGSVPEKGVGEPSEK
ncbi:hypothetical protein NUU61_002203 [Penicillium alfredii]|uniref:Uncharacterized protein n=1 Tax=Penicillium alfredii TaxID=1506179 RepID=A0A9W9FR17_9EURO|nr:uncharacterized protein NUU61_002203 [Penicillium alfredii]KAJ5104856.1 hypothetical protein NUU61_002203 [Penicillium alfredii]